MNLGSHNLVKRLLAALKKPLETVIDATSSWESVVADEMQCVRFRRDFIGRGHLAMVRGSASAPTNTAASAEPNTTLTNAVRDISANPSTDPIDLTGLSLSGGGVRSASFCLGVLQALDLASTGDQPPVLDKLDYLSTVSGGGYIGTSYICSAMQGSYTFPFKSKASGDETPETQHLRDFSNFLAPNGFIDYLTSAALMLRGLLVNLVIIAWIVLIPVLVTLWFHPRISDLSAPSTFMQKVSFGALQWFSIPGYEGFAFGIFMLCVLLFVMLTSAILTSFDFNVSTLRSRDNLGRVLAGAILVSALVLLFEFQPYILANILSIPSGTGDLHSGRPSFERFFHSLMAFLAPAAAVLVASAQKLAKLANASADTYKWSTALKKYASKAALYAAGVIVPASLWIAYLYLCAWAYTDAATRCGYTVSAWKGCTGFSVLSTFIWVAAGTFVLGLFIGPNANSLHRLYRDRLSRAFLFERGKLPSRDTEIATGAGDISVDKWKFSTLKPKSSPGGAWQQAASYAPYLIVNTAINLEKSPTLNKRGRNADTFVFTPLHVGSTATGYVPTAKIENAVPDLSMATAMAISGAAASANMGKRTIPILTFSLSILNVRLGYWLASPQRLGSFATVIGRRIANIGMLYFAAETLGRLKERTRNIYLTDGGHIENLGLYELLRRRCKVIVAVDAEADPALTFPSFVNLQVMARIDFGIRIDLPWQLIQAQSASVDGENLYGRSGYPGTQGPHVAVGQIQYGNNECGVLIYIKSSLSGDENDYVLDYKRGNPTFPHETTIDQFFTEDQFEVYRALGFHAAKGFFDGTDTFATLQGGARPSDWRWTVQNALIKLNIRADIAQSIAMRA